MRGHEIDFLQQLAASTDWSQTTAGREIFITNITKCILAEHNKKQVATLLDLIADQSPSDRWRQMAMLNAFPDPAEAAHRNRKTVLLDAEPSKLLALQSKYPSPANVKLSNTNAKLTADEQVGAGLNRVFAMIHWVGQPGYVPPPPPPPLTPAEQARYQAGRAVFTRTCMQCHKTDGMGQAGLAPPLADSEWVLGPDSRILRIVLHGLAGSVTVDDQTFHLEMPALGPSLNDDDIAAVLTYVRHSWDNEAPAVTSERVAKARKNTRKRKTPWSERELMRIN